MNTQAIGYGYPGAAETIAEFCAANRISRTTLFNLMKAGKGPRVMRIGRRVLISTEAGAEWRRKLEADSAVEVAA